jgi:glycerophosphoryl diester phosphodiesterase
VSERPDPTPFSGPRARLLPEHRPFVVAHRMGNSREHVDEAVAAGADIVEADIHLYRRRLEVRHTKTLGVLPWLWDRWYLVPAADPRLTLAELMTELREDVILMLDLKGWQPWHGRTVAAAMEAAAPGRPYLVSTGAWHMLAAFEPLPHVGIIHTIADRRHAARIKLRLRHHRTDAIGVRRQLLADRGLAATVRELAPVVFTWPVNSHATAREALARGANALIVDGTDLIAALAAQRRPPMRRDTPGR